MMEMGASHQQQLHRTEVNMAHMAHNAGGPASVSTTIRTMPQTVPVPAPAYTAAGYTAPPVAHTPPHTTIATIVTARRGRGRRTGFEAAPPAAGGTYAQRAATTPNKNASAYVQNDYKVFNNWNKCFSCGSDVPNWHTSATCPVECHVPGHQAGYIGKTSTGQVASDHAQYMAAGHTPSKRKAHKKYLSRAGTGRP